MENTMFRAVFIACAWWWWRSLTFCLEHFEMPILRSEGPDRVSNGHFQNATDKLSFWKSLELAVVLTVKQ